MLTKLIPKIAKPAQFFTDRLLEEYVDAIEEVRQRNAKAKLISFASNCLVNRLNIMMLSREATAALSSPQTQARIPKSSKYLLEMSLNDYELVIA